MIAIIPARGGSKGLPKKNIKLLDGKPLIAYTIEAAKKSEYVDRVIVTTDDIAIADIARQYGAEVPFIRPEYLATDTASAIDVYIHAAEYLRNNYGDNIEHFIVLLPTTPLRQTKHIDEAVTLFMISKANTLVSMKEADTPISWYYEINEGNSVNNAGFDSNSMDNRQANRKYFVPNGAIYILSYNLLKEKRTYYCNSTIAYVMTQEDSIDIDTPLDFKIAEALIKER